MNRIPSLPLAVSTAFALLLVASPAATQTVYDDFNGAVLSFAKWEVDKADRKHFKLSGGTLQFDAPPNSLDIHAEGTQHFRGDFEFVLDFRNYSTTNTTFGQPPGVIFKVYDMSGSGDFIWFSRWRGLNGDEFFVRPWRNRWGTAFTAPTNAASGLMKIDRVGSEIRAWYDTGGGWTLLASYSNSFMGDAAPSIGAWSGDSGTFHVECDYIQVTGKPVRAMPDLKVNGSDDPVSVNQGAQVDVTIALTAHSLAGQPGDLFALARASFGDYWLNSSNQWIRSPIPFPMFSGIISDLPTTTILSLNKLPRGTYQFFFGADSTGNGRLNPDDTIADLVPVTVR